MDIHIWSLYDDTRIFSHYNEIWNIAKYFIILKIQEKNYTNIIYTNLTLFSNKNNVTCNDWMIYVFF